VADVKEILDEFCKQAGGALTSLLGDEVTLALSENKEAPAEEVKTAVSGRSLLISLEVTGEASGTVAVVMPEGGAARAAILLTGEDKAPESLSDLHLSALSEVGSQLVDALTTVLSGISGSISIQASEPKVIEAEALETETPLAFADGNPTLAIGTITTKGEEGPFWLVVSQGLVGALSKAEGFAEGVPSSAPSKEGAGPTVRPAGLTDMSSEVQPGDVTNLDLLQDVALQVTVELGRTSKNIKEILSFSPGSIIGLDKLEGEPVDIFVNDMLFAKGEVVVIDESFGVRIAEIISPKDRLDQLQALTR